MAVPPTADPTITMGAWHQAVVATRHAGIEKPATRPCDCVTCIMCRCRYHRGVVILAACVYV
eukprot:1323218-Pyramimonas_sp.AAC.2